MFTIQKLIGKIFQGMSRKKTADEITFFEVKELYNRAYEEKARARLALRQFRRIEAQAKAKDQAYRAQLSSNRPAYRQAA